MKGTDTKLLSRYQINKLCDNVSYEGFKVEWIQKATDSNGNKIETREENFGVRMNLCDTIRSYANRDKIKNDIDYSNSNESIGIINSCNGAVHPVT